MRPIDFSVGRSLSEVHPYNTHRGIGLNELRQLARAKREESVRSGVGIPVPHMVGSFGFK